MPAYPRPAWLLGAVLACVSTPTLACVMAPPASGEVVAERVRNYQAELWSRSDVVFLSEAGSFDRVVLTGSGMQGVSATLSPSLALKGELPAGRIDIRHTTATSCGPIPFLDALSGREGDWFVTFGRRVSSGLSVDATVPVADLVDAEALRAWRKAYGPDAS